MTSEHAAFNAGTTELVIDCYEHSYKQQSRPIVDIAELLQQLHGGKQLKRLVIRHVGAITHLELLEQFTELTELEISCVARNKDSKLDLEFLHRLPSLQVLRLTSVAVYSLEPITALKELREAEISYIDTEDAPSVTTPQRKSILQRLAGIAHLRLLSRPDNRWADCRVSLSIFANCSQLHALKLGGIAVEDSEVLETLPALKTLQISGCQALDFKESLQLPALRTALFHNSNFSSFTWLASTTMLRKLAMTSCKVHGKRLGDGHLPQLRSKKLREFIAEYAEFSSLNFLQHCKQLRVLMLPHCHGKGFDISALSCLKRLRHVNIIDSPLRNIGPLAGHRKMTYLWLGGCWYLKDITPLALLTELNWIGLNSTGVTDVAPLRSCRKLKTVGLDHCNIADFSPLHDLPELTYVQHAKVGNFRAYLSEQSETATAS